MKAFFFAGALCILLLLGLCACGQAKSFLVPYGVSRIIVATKIYSMPYMTLTETAQTSCCWVLATLDTRTKMI